MPCGSGTPSARYWPVEMTSRCCRPVGALNVAIDWSLVGDVASPTSSGESADRSSTTRLKAASTSARSLEVALVISAPCAAKPGCVTSSFVNGWIGRLFWNDALPPFV